ncbi:toll/interleukin-1 receptor domain-containing protein [Sphaerisporangium sp. TRM90804]|uniref:toll/interleukin-1 receptor domain-containing protein n=1 Tax=Sphaerisporangium sp. TRM90804 TaxID=3031113 RepID=UPI0024494756|nr:toll/interleukin-1 receptor domain-containing protein [Sphaerisporangium sp. TRM90804]MDH2426931.1 toll/interleukin-1 receptor domain-containing protein [Sphaerisporangium sp. TRM90804]
MASHDLFISHASEDKQDLARPLAHTLGQLGVDVWYDEYTLSVGDSLSASIDKGLNESNYGLVIISPDFIRKPWPEYEFRSLITLEVGHRKRILPIWHNVTQEDVTKYSPHLADKVALIATGKPTLHVAIEIMRAATPDKFSQLTRRLARRQLENENMENVPLNQMERWPTLREPLEQSQLRRLRLVQASLSEVFPQTWDEIVSDFQRDQKDKREDEIQCWEKIAGTYAHICDRFTLGIKEKKRLFNTLLAATFGDVELDTNAPEWLIAAAADFNDDLRDARS